MNAVEGLDQLWDSFSPPTLADAAPFVGAYYDGANQRYRCVTFLKQMRTEASLALVLAAHELVRARRDTIDPNWLHVYGSHFALPASHTSITGGTYPAPASFVQRAAAFAARMRAQYPRVVWVLLYEYQEEGATFGVHHGEDWSGGDAYPLIELFASLGTAACRSPKPLIMDITQVNLGNNFSPLVDQVGDAFNVLREMVTAAAARPAPAAAAVATQKKGKEEADDDDDDDDDSDVRAMDLDEAVREGGGGGDD